MSTESGRPITLIGLPYSMGRRGATGRYQFARGPEVMLQDEMVPSALRSVFSDVDTKMILNADEPSLADVDFDFRLLPDGDQMSRYLVQNRRLGEAVRAASRAGRFPVASVGGCINALGMVAGLDDPELGVIWWDAHADAETPDTSRNGFMEGMVASTIAGKCWPVYREMMDGFHIVPEESIIQVGLHEAHSAVSRPGTYATVGRVINPPEITRAGGFAPALRAAVDDLATRTRRVYVHFDLDVLDSVEALRASSHTAVGGLSLEEVRQGMEIIAQRLTVSAIAFASWDPSQDHRAAAIIPEMVKDVVARVAGGEHRTRPGGVVRGAGARRQDNDSTKVRVNHAAP